LIVALMALAVAVPAAILIDGSNGDSGSADQSTTVAPLRSKPGRVDPAIARGSARPPFHSPDRLPSARWRPFASDSPWNRRVPRNPRIDRRSSRYVKRLLETGSVDDLRAGTTGTASDFGHAIYFASNSDPLYTVRGGSRVEPYRIDGKRVRLPDKAQPAAGGDGHLAVVFDGNHWGCYDTTVDHAARVIRCRAGRKVPIDGVGLRAAETAARFPSLAGRIRYQEIVAGRIRHAIFAASSQIAYTWVYPAFGSGAHRDPSEGYPPMGTRFQLDPRYMTNRRLATYPAWKRALLRAVRDYGFYLGDSSGSTLKLFAIESGTGYTSFGLPDPWVRFARANNIPSSHDSSIDRTVYRFDLDSGVDWSRLRVIHPCVTAKDC
jgi:hypothetical protein